MSDVKVVRYLLANNAALLAVVPSAKIFAGVVPLLTVMPAVSVTHVSGVWNSEISKQGRTCRARTQVTVMATGYAQQKQIMALVRAAIPRARGVINGVTVGSIEREPSGPDFTNEEVTVFFQVQDFIISFFE